MSASLSPEQYGSIQSQSPPAGSDGRSPTGLNLEFFKNLNDKRTTRVDGKTPKRRGPKPDSKPALTRRQELNRQAQRTHRERKELYIKALEDEVLRLKEIYSTVSQDREKLAEENRLLRDTLARNGLNIPRSTNGDNNDGNNPSTGSGFGGSSHGGFSPQQAHSHGSAPSAGGGYNNFSQPTGSQYRKATQSSNRATKLDVEQAGIDFVLALEKPCMAHLPFLMDRSAGPQGDACGHALMASCPPVPFKDLSASRPFKGADDVVVKKEEPSQGTWQVNKADLSTLLDLSKRLDLDGEITPVMAWGMIMSHPQFAVLSPEDVRRIAEDLGRKVRCYGFGAVMEDFELRDAFESVCSNRIEQLVY